MAALNVNAITTPDPAAVTPRRVQPERQNENNNLSVNENRPDAGNKPADRVTEPPERSTSAPVDLSREKEDIASVSVSEDGDVVAVSENGVKAFNGEDDGRVLREENEEFALTEETEEKTYEPEINSLVGYTENQVFELYRDGRISYNDYQDHVEAEKAEKETAKEELKKDDAVLAAANEALRRTDESNIAIKNINGQESGDAIDAMNRVNGTDTEGDERNASRNPSEGVRIPGEVNIQVDKGSTRGEVENSRSERKAAEEGRLWDYQLRA